MDIYVVTTFDDIKKRNFINGETVIGMKFQGFYLTQEEAMNSVENPESKLSLALPYKYVAIQQVRDGLYGFVETKKWYIYNESKNINEQIDKVSDDVFFNPCSIG